MRALRSTLVALSLVVAACSVARPTDLRTRLWVCDSDSDCLDGWGCADRSVLGEDFCRPGCDPADPSSCDGVCTPTGECLARCTLWGDITSRCPEDHACVRTDLLGDDGVCFPAHSCSRSDECGEGTRCLNDVLSLPTAVPGLQYSADHLYCIAVPDAERRCATGYLAVPGAEGTGAALCLPRCDSEGSRCPPVFTCLRGMGYLFAQPGTSPCYPGTWGLPCDDDAQCIVGRCLEVGGGRRACTHTCAEAERLFPGPSGGCELLEQVAASLRLEALAFDCEPVAAERICVPRGITGAPCNADMLCAPGLECRAIGGTSNLVELCTRDCDSDQDCEYPGAPITAYCHRDVGGGTCLPRSSEGGRCVRDEHCRPGLACLEARCVRLIP